jgi:uncharacterized protein YqjF (DUF2071 family)
VWFFSLDAASSLAVVGGRLGFALPYFRSDMALERSGDRVRYQLRRRWPAPRDAALEVDYEVGEALGCAQPGTLEHFLVERYSLFARRRHGPLLRADVRHAPYPLRRARVGAVSESLLAAARIRGDDPRPPDLYSDGVDVDIFPPRRA